MPSIRRRLVTMLYESLLLLGVLALMIVPLVVLGALGQVQVPHPVLRVYIFLGLALYFIWQWQGSKQTLAMRTWKISIATSDGMPAPPWRLALRYVLAWPSLFLFGFGLIWAIFDRDRQFLHDRLAGTRVIFAPPTKS